MTPPELTEPEIQTLLTRVPRLRAEIGKMELDHVFSERHALTQRISKELEETASKWGIRFTRVPSL